MIEEHCDMKHEMKGLGWRVSLSILVGVGWLVFLILWLFFYANQYAWEKNMAIFLFSLLVLVGIVGVPWAYWGLKNQSAQEKEMWKIKGFRWRIGVTLVVALVVFLFLIYWFWYLAAPYDVYQNIAIFIVSFLIMGGLLGAMWAPWGMRYGHQHHHEHDKEE
jgi:hypothetical protein